MPLPKPRNNETQDDFVSRCVSDPDVKKEFTSTKQASAVCFDIWRQEKGGKKPTDLSIESDGKMTFTEEMKISKKSAMFSNEEVEIIETEGEKPRFKIKANSGKPIDGHWAWGNFSIDMNGLKIGRQKKPVLRDHDPKDIVGFTDSISVNGKGELITEGYFTDIENNYVLARMKEGFPWQASVYVPPLKIERLSEGDKEIVNGHELTGPGNIFRSAKLREITVTSLGADEDTDASLLSEGEKDHIKVEIVKKEKFMADLEKNEEVVEPKVATFSEADIEKAKKEAFDAGINSERDRIKGIREFAFSDQGELVEQMINDGVKLSDAKDMIIKAEKQKKADKLSALKNEAPDPVGPTASDNSDKLKEQKGRSEFSSNENYEAYKEAKEKGLIK